MIKACGSSNIKKNILIGCIFFSYLIFMIYLFTSNWLIMDIYWMSPILYLLIIGTIARSYVYLLDIELYAGVSSKLLFIPLLLVPDEALKNIYPQAMLILGPGYGFTTPLEIYLLFIVGIISKKYGLRLETNFLWRWTPHIFSTLFLIFYLYLIFYGNINRKRIIGKLFYGLSIIYNIALVVSSLFGLAPVLLVINMIFLTANTYRLLTT